jgi:hypothetical protein
MECQRNVSSILPTQLPHNFLYIVAILIHNHFESLNTLKVITKHFSIGEVKQGQTRSVFGWVTAKKLRTA